MINSPRFLTIINKVDVERGAWAGVCAVEGRCNCRECNCAGACSKTGNIGDPDRIRYGSGPGWRRHRSPALRDPEVTSLAFPPRRSILLPNGSNSCAKLYPRSPVGDLGQHRKSEHGTGGGRDSNRGPHPEIRRAEDIAPAFAALKGASFACWRGHEHGRTIPLADSPPLWVDSINHSANGHLRRASGFAFP